MFGFATDETPDLMPAPIRYAHKLAAKLHEVRISGLIPYLRPDGKTQVSAEYNNETLQRVDTIVISTQHEPDVTQEQIKQDLMMHVILPVMGETIDDKTIFHINPTGLFII
ncbi:MAG: S-adenosylmethionine synthase [Candidatus Parcubacteria bacterium]|jgi:S-adenosylmethionine synthetase